MKKKILILLIVSALIFIAIANHLIRNDINRNRSDLETRLSHAYKGLIFLKTNQFFINSLEFKSSGSIAVMLENYLMTQDTQPETAFVYSLDERNIFSFAAKKESDNTLSTLTLLLDNYKFDLNDFDSVDKSVVEIEGKIFLYVPVILEDGRRYGLVAVIDENIFLDTFPIFSGISYNNGRQLDFDIDLNYKYILHSHLKVLVPILIIILLLVFFSLDLMNAYTNLKIMLNNLSEGKLLTSNPRTNFIFKDLITDAIKAGESFRKKHDEASKISLEVMLKQNKIDGIVESAQTIAHDIGEISYFVEALMESFLETIADINDFLQKSQNKLPHCVESNIRFLQKHANMIIKYYDYVRKLINDLKNIDKCHKLNLKESDVKDIVMLLVEEIKIIIPEHIKYRLNFMHTKLVLIDEKMIARVIYNFLKNCVDASVVDGEVWIITKDISNGVEITIGNIGYVSDGDTLKNKGKYFTKGKEQGTGLGLMICENILKAHKSSFDIRTDIEHSQTEFIFSLESPIT